MNRVPVFLVNLTSSEVHGWEWNAGVPVALTIDAPEQNGRKSIQAQHSRNNKGRNPGRLYLVQFPT